MKEFFKTGSISRLLLKASPLLIAGIAGCGGGAASLTKSAALSGTITVPSGTPTRGVAGSIPLPGATVNLYDITSTGTAALNGSPIETTTSDASGNYNFSTTTPGHSYIVEASKTVTSTSGTPTTLQLGSYVHVAATGPVTEPVDPDTTVASSYVLQQISNNIATPSEDLTSLEQNFEANVTAQAAAGTAPAIDLSKGLEQHQAEISSVESEAAKSISRLAFVSKDPWATGSSDSGDSNSSTQAQGLVQLVTDPTTSTVQAVIIITDSNLNVTDADEVTAPIASDGSFAGSSTDGLYKITGNLDGGEAHGTWTASTGNLSGHWEATAHNDAGTKSVAVMGTFTTSGSTAPANTGTGGVFVMPDGRAIAFAQDNSKTATHNSGTAVTLGTAVVSTGTMTVTNGWPAATGVIPSGTVVITTTPGTTTVSGTFTFMGLAQGNEFNSSGTFTGSSY